MASAIKGPIAWTEESGALSEAAFTLDSLPFCAALVDAAGLVVAANQRWGRGGCADRYRSGALEAGLETVLRRNAETFVGHYECDSRWYRATIARHGSGALILEQPGEPSATPEAEKLETIGRLVGGVAHDFANLLTLIAGYSDILLNRMGEKDPLRPEMEEIRKAAGRGSRLTAQLLGFTRGQSVAPRILDLNTLLTDLWRMLQPIIGEYVEVRTDLDGALQKVVADPGQMEQVIMNLILNARDAMPHGGKIVIRTSNCELGKETAQIHGMEPGPSVLLSISDTGHGIEPGDLERLWEPFFTTKEKGKGTGLGLSIVRKIIKECRGDIGVQSVPGEGTTFTVWLPRAQELRDHREAPPAAASAGAGTETLLVVEDQEDVRRLLTQVLRRRGYRLLEASNGEEALHLFAEHAAEIDLVLTDMVMPGMSGRELALRLTQSRPDTKIMFMSGYTDDVLVRTGALRPGMSFLQKPLRTEVLAAKVREALDSPVQPFAPR